MNELHLITDTDRRGAQVFALDLSRALHGDHQSVVALTSGTQRAGSGVTILGPGRLHPVTLRALRRQMRRVDVVVAHGSSTLVASALAGLGLPVPVIYRQISDQNFWASSWSRRARVKLYLKRVAHVVALWSGAARTLVDDFRFPENRITVIANAVPARRFWAPDEAERATARSKFGLDAGYPVVLSMGALVREKGVDVTIRAMGDLPSAQLLIVGAGPEQPLLEALANQVAPGRVRFHPPQEDTSFVYAAADVLALPSRGGDSMPAVLIEAGLQELPAAVTPVQGIVDVVLDGRTGRIVKEPEPVALAAALQECLDWARTWGPAARAHCLANYDVEVVAEQWRALLHTVSSKGT